MKMWIGFSWRKKVQWLLWTRQWTFGLHVNRELAWTAEVLLASQEGLHSMELVI